MDGSDRLNQLMATPAVHFIIMFLSLFSYTSCARFECLHMLFKEILHAMIFIFKYNFTKGLRQGTAHRSEFVVPKCTVQ